MSVALMYHDIVTKEDKSSGFQNESAFQYKVEEFAFEEHVKALQGRDVVYTFDDGGESFYTKAAPILEKYGFKGVFFISTKYIDTLGFLTSEQLKALFERGHVVGSHSHTHPDDFTKLSREEIHKEWQQSYEILKSILGDNPFAASIPNGCASEMVLEEAVACGFTDIYTSQPTTKIHSFQKQNIIGRYVVHDNMTTQDVLKIVTSKTCRLKLSIMWNMLNVIKKVLGPSYKAIKQKVLH